MKDKKHGLCLSLYDHRNNPERVHDLEKQVDQLSVPLEKLEEEESVKRSQYLAATIAHSRVYCQALSEKVTRAVPREIRDMIYGYLCEKMIRISVRPLDHRKRGSTGMSKQKQAFKGPYIDRLETPLPYLFSQKYLAKEFLVELAPMLYTKATFHIWDLTDIADFLSQDFFRLGCLPKDHARKLSLVIFTDYYGQRCSSKRDIEEKLSHLSHLFQVKHQQGFRLDLHLCISQHKHWPTVARFHQILLPYLYDFKDAGFTIRLPLKTYHYNEKRKSDRSEMNQLQSSDSTDPEDWLVDDAELDSWKESEDIQNAFKKSARHTARFYDDYTDESEWEDDHSPLPSDFEDGSVASDEEDPYH